MSNHASHFGDGEHITYCRICDAKCGLVATVKEGVITRLLPDRKSLHSHGHVCVKGTSFHDITHDPARVLRPLKRVGGPGEFEPVSWDEALDDIASRMKAIIAESGPDAFALYIGNPNAYSSLNVLYGVGFAAACGSRKTYGASSQDSNAQIKANELLHGAPYPFTIPDLPQTDLIFIFGANPLVSSGSILSAPRIFDELNAIHTRGRVVVFDPRRTETARAYDHVPVNPATDAWLLAAMLKEIIEEGLADRRFMDAHAHGFDRLAGLLARIDTQQAASLCGVPAARIRDLALLFARTPRASVYGRVGIGRNKFATLSNLLMNMLTIVTGKFGKSGSNGFGYRMSRPAENTAPEAPVEPAKTRIGGFSAAGGHLATAMLAADITEPGPGRVRAFLGMSGNPVLSAPNGAELSAALERLDLHFSIDLYRNETNSHAHYILPSTSFLERQDSTFGFVNLMVRPHLVATRAVIPPLGEAREEHVILFELSRRMDIGTPLPMIPMPDFVQAKGYKPEHHDLVDMAIRLSDIGDHYGENPEGVTMERLLNEFPHGYPLPQRELLGESLDQISYPDKRIQLCNDVIAGELRRLIEGMTSPQPRLKLIGRRNIRSVNSWMHNSDRLARSLRPTLLIHPDDAEESGVDDGGEVVVRSKTGAIKVIVEITEEMKPGTVSYPHGYGHSGGWPRANAIDGANINSLASTDPADVEAVSGASLLDGIAVTIESTRAIGFKSGL